MSKKLLFEGAGWEKAESNDVGNCRIRTRIKNNEGRVIYLEMGTCNRQGNFLQIHISHCFDVKDQESNHTKDLCQFEGVQYHKYTKANILQFVNRELNCSFDEMEVINDNSIRVHDTKNPLCG